MIWYCTTNVFHYSSTINFGESLYFVHLWKTKRRVWRVEHICPFVHICSLSGTLCLFSLSYFLLLSNKRIFFFFLYLPNHRSVLWFNSFTTQPQHRSLSTNPYQQKNLKPKNICSRSAWEKSQKKKNGAQSLKRCLWSRSVGWWMCEKAEIKGKRARFQNSLCLSTSIFLSFSMSREFLERESKPWLPMAFLDVYGGISADLNRAKGDG